jgi:hypothetical protein
MCFAILGAVSVRQSVLQEVTYTAAEDLGRVQVVIVRETHAEELVVEERFVCLVLQASVSLGTEIRMMIQVEAAEGQRPSGQEGLEQYG